MFPATLLIEIITFILAIVYLKKRYTGWYFYFVPFMLFIIVAEGAGYIMAFFFRRNNHWVYNIEMLGEIIFIPWVFYRLFTEKKLKGRFIIIGGLLPLLIAFPIETSTNNWVIYNTNTYMLMSAVFIIYAGTYFYNVLKTPEPVNLLASPSLWISAGVFVFYFAGTAVSVFFEQIMQLNITKGIPLRYLIFIILNAILYGCWSYAFRCLHRQTISSSR